MSPPLLSITVYPMVKGFILMRFTSCGEKRLQVLENDRQFNIIRYIKRLLVQGLGSNLSLLSTIIIRCGLSGHSSETYLGMHIYENYIPDIRI